MRHSSDRNRSAPGSRRRFPVPTLEHLEERQLLDDQGLAVFLDVEPNNLLTQAASLGVPGIDWNILHGRIGEQSAADNDVDWYRFELPGAAHVRLTSTANSVLSLYVRSDPTDHFVSSGHRLVSQSTSDNDSLEQTLGAGTYWIAISGEGNRYFHPMLANSGLPGRTSAYRVQVQTTAMYLAPTDGPIVLAVSPGEGDTLLSSPRVIRVRLSAALDETSLVPNENLILQRVFADDSSEIVELTGAHVDLFTNELRLIPGAVLTPGQYRLSLFGDVGAHDSFLLDLNGMPLGATLDHEFGQDFHHDFHVAGSEGMASDQPISDSTPEQAHWLGVLNHQSHVQALGSIGDDPTLSEPFSTEDVEFYRFSLTGNERHLIGVEVFATRFGSSLDAELALYRVETSGNWTLLNHNTDSRNSSSTAQGALPLFADPFLYQGLTAGTYAIAVRSQADGLGVRQTRGDYVLNVYHQRDTRPPRLLSSSVSEDQVLRQPPARIVLRFSEGVNLSQLAAEAHRDIPGQIDQVYFLHSSGERFYPQLESFNPSTNEATFLLTDALPNGDYQLILAGSQGLTDFIGNPLVGNAGNGDLVLPFTLSGPPRGTAGDPRLWTYSPTSASIGHEQSLGLLYPQELEQIVRIVRAPAGVGQPNHVSRTDRYQFEVTLARSYSFTLTGSPLPPGIQFTVVDEHNTPVLGVAPSETLFAAFLQPGTYRIVVTGWDAAQAANLSYEVRITTISNEDSLPPLTVGPMPGLPVNLNLASPAPTTPTPTPITLTPPPPPQLTLQPPSTNRVVPVSMVTTTSPTTSVPPLLLPGNLVSALGTNPLDPVATSSSGSSTTTEQLVLQPPLPSFLNETLSSLVLLTQVGETDSGEATPIPVTSVERVWSEVTRQWRTEIVQPVLQLIDAVFASLERTPLRGWRKTPNGSLPVPGSTPEKTSALDVTSPESPVDEEQAETSLPEVFALGGVILAASCLPTKKQRSTVAPWMN